MESTLRLRRFGDRVYYYLPSMKKWLLTDASKSDSEMISLVAAPDNDTPSDITFDETWAAMRYQLGEDEGRYFIDTKRVDAVPDGNGTTSMFGVTYEGYNGPYLFLSTSFLPRKDRKKNVEFSYPGFETNWQEGEEKRVVLCETKAEAAVSAVFVHDVIVTEVEQPKKVTKIQIRNFAISDVEYNYLRTKYTQSEPARVAMELKMKAEREAPKTDAVAHNAPVAEEVYVFHPDKKCVVASLYTGKGLVKEVKRVDLKENGWGELLERVSRQPKELTLCPSQVRKKMEEGKEKEASESLRKTMPQPEVHYVSQYGYTGHLEMWIGQEMPSSVPARKVIIHKKFATASGINNNNECLIMELERYEEIFKDDDASRKVGQKQKRSEYDNTMQDLVNAVKIAQNQ